MSLQKTQKPEWLKVSLNASRNLGRVREAISDGGLNTVCREARCPNRTECHNLGTATFLLLGDECTRGCGFCAVKRNAGPNPPDPGEPLKVARAAQKMGLGYVVLTSVTRDDLPDKGAAHYAKTVASIKALPTSPRVEVLTPDFGERELKALLKGGVDVFAHNIEVVKRLGAVRHPAFSYEKSLSTLAKAKRISRGGLTKSSILLGLGETIGEVLEAMGDLRSVGVDILSLGQYLSPGPQNTRVARYVTPAEFDELKAAADSMGFSFTASSPLVRTSYKAKEAYEHCHGI